MTTRAQTNPFPGLRPFMQKEADLFFGRDRQSDDLVMRLASRRFLAVVGTSGSGKSSLVRAGLLPSLEGGLMAAAGTHWRMAIMRPQDDPIGFLARAIADAGALTHLDITPAAAPGVIETTLRRSSLGLVEAARLAKPEPHDNLLVLVDQFEELFRFADLARQRGVGDEAPAFVKLLLEAARQTTVPVYVVITMRSDFLGDCARFRDLPEAISDSQYLIPRLTRDQLQAVITGPIGVRGGRIAPSLLQHLLNDVGDDMDQLPVLQHALMRAWDQWQCHDPDARSIDLHDLTEIGGMTDALSQHADEAFAALTSDGDRAIAERLFKCLTERGADNREIRHPTSLARIAAIADANPTDVIRVVDVFRAPGRSFLMPSCDVALDHDSILDISHESLIRQWAQLRTWVGEEAESRATYLRVVDAARLRQDGKAGLWGEPELTYARGWWERQRPNATWAARYGSDFDAAGAFLRDSEAAHAAELEREREDIEAQRMATERELEQAKALAAAQRQRADEYASARIRQRRFSIALVTLLALAAGIATYAWQQRTAAEAKRREAESQSALALSRQLAGLANDEIERGLQITALLAVAANRAAPANEARQILQRVLTSEATQPRPRTFLSGHPDEVLSVAFSPDGKTVASASRDGTVILWNAPTGTPLSEPLDAKDGAALAVAFSPDGNTLAVARGDSVVLWDVAQRRRVAETLAGHEAVSVAFSPNGKTLAAAGANGVVILWDVATGTPIGEPFHGRSGFGRRYNGVAFSPDGKTLASGSFEEGILWDVASHNPLGVPLKGHDQGVVGMAFSPDGTTVASASDDGSVILWDVATHTAMGQPLQPHHGRVNSMAFSPDGKTLASASAEDKAVILWDVQRRAARGEPLKGHRSAVTSVAFSPDGKTLASGSEDQTVILWDVEGHPLLGEPFEGHQGRVFGVAFSPDGRTLASASGDQSVILWDVAQHKPLGEALKGHQGAVSSVAFSPDGKTLASGSQDTFVYLWDVVTHKRVGQLEGHGKDVTSVAFSPDGKTLASRDGDDTVILWNLPGRTRQGGPLTPAETNVAFLPNGTAIASGSPNRSVLLWDVATRKSIGEAPLVDKDSAISIAFSPDGKTLTAGTYLGNVTWWDVATRRRLGEPFKAHREGAFVYSVAFSPDGKTLASGSYDHTVILWDAARRKPIGNPLVWGYDSIQGIAFSPDGRALASASDSKIVIMWDVDPISWMSKACAVANRNLTHREWARYVGDEVPYRAPCPEFSIPVD